MLSGSAASLTKMAHVTDAVPVRLLFVIDASQPPLSSCRRRHSLRLSDYSSTVSATDLQATPPTLLVTLVLYLTESAKYASSAVTRLRRSDFRSEERRVGKELRNLGIATASKKKMINTTISSSMSVKPLRFMTGSYVLKDIG